MPLRNFAFRCRGRVKSGVICEFSVSAESLASVLFINQHIDWFIWFVINKLYVLLEKNTFPWYLFMKYTLIKGYLLFGKASITKLLLLFFFISKGISVDYSNFIGPGSLSKKKQKNIQNLILAGICVAVVFFLEL